MDRVREGNIPRRLEAGDIRAVFIFNPEKDPNSSAGYLREGDNKRYESAMLEVVGVDGVEDPVESKYRVQEHGRIVIIRIFIASNITKKAFRGMGLEERPIHQ